jgi:hypothetical protein
VDFAYYVKYALSHIGFLQIVILFEDSKIHLYSLHLEIFITFSHQQLNSKKRKEKKKRKERGQLKCANLAFVLNSGFRKVCLYMHMREILVIFFYIYIYIFFSYEDTKFFL